MESSEAVKESYLEVVHLFLSHAPLENYIMKIEAKSKAAQKSITGSVGNPIQKSLKTVFTLVFIETMLAVNRTSIMLLLKSQQLLQYAEDLVVDKSMIRSLISKFITPVILNRSAVDFEMFEAAVISFETLIKQKVKYVSDQHKAMIVDSLIVAFESILNNKDTITNESYAGLLIGTLPVIYPSNLDILVQHRLRLMALIDSVMSTNICFDRRNMILTLWSNLIKQLRTMRSSMTSHDLTYSTDSLSPQKSSPLKKYSIHVAAARHAHDDSALHSHTSSLQAYTIIAQISVDVFRVICRHFDAGHQSMDNCMVDAVGSLTAYEFTYYVQRLDDSMDYRKSAELIYGRLVKDKHRQMYCEKVMTSVVDLKIKLRFVDDYLSMIASSAITSDKTCSLGRVIDSNRMQLAELGYSRLAKLMELVLECLASEKKKIVSNAIRMAGILFANLSLESIELLKNKVKHGKQDCLDFIMKQFKKHLASDFMKYTRNATYSIKWISSKFDAFNKTQDLSQSPCHKILINQCLECLPIVIDNFIKSNNVKLRLISLSVIDSRHAISSIDTGKLLDIAGSIQLLLTGRWMQQAIPEYSDAKHLESLKIQSAEYLVTLTVRFDELGIDDSDFYVPVLACFDSVIDSLRSAITSQGVPFESEDGDTGKLSLIPVLKIRKTPQILTAMECLALARRKLQKFDDLCLSLLRYEKMNKLLDGRTSKDDDMTIDNVFVDLRVTNE